MGIARCKIRILQSRRAQKRQRWYMRNSVIKLRLSQVLPELTGVLFVVARSIRPGARATRGSPRSVLSACAASPTLGPPPACSHRLVLPSVLLRLRLRLVHIAIMSCFSASARSR